MNKLFIIAILFLLSACESIEQPEQISPEGYDLTKAEKFIMPDALLEISGIAFNNGNSDTLYAQEDENGKIFWLKLGEKKFQSSKFSKRGDYEDITLMNGQVFMLRSYGTIFNFSLTASQQNEVPGVTQYEGLLPDGEFESLFGDAQANKLYVICKQCSQDKGTNIASGYVLQWEGDSTLKRVSDFSLHTDSIQEPKGRKGKPQRFEPSAFAINPITREWYILSSVNKMLVIADGNWSIKKVFPLDPARFRQPEGIAFDTAGNLYISNEGDEISNGNVLKFTYHKKS